MSAQGGANSEAMDVNKSGDNDLSLPPSSTSKSEPTTSRPIIPWKDPALKKAFLGLVHRDQAFKRTAESYSQKFDAIAAELMSNHDSFKKYGKIKGSSLEKQFRRYRDGLLKQITSNSGEIQIAAVERLSEVDKLLYKMIVESNDTMGKEGNLNSKNLEKKRPLSFLPENTSSLSDRNSPTAVDINETEAKRSRGATDEQREPLLDSSDSDSPRETSKQRSSSYEELGRCIERAAERVVCPDVLESIARDVKETQEAQRFQAEALKTLMHTAVEMNSRIGALNSSVNKLVDLMTELVRLQKAR